MIRIIFSYWIVLVVYDIVVSAFGIFTNPNLSDRMFFDLRFGGLLLMAWWLSMRLPQSPHGKETP